ncbi:MAG: methyltransferase domain-containing protein [Chlamydiae bacterium]|nr:methyltransferase domain-containing protein [Chlamydiota bacterium]MBI3266856.1 methyltransferase domain-containing protein [Chlamydiota bacterium]
MNAETWPLRLFKKSVLKQNKFKNITRLLGQTQGLSCLDIGSDNGVVSFFLRQRGGSWKSADLDERSVQCIRELVGDPVYQINGLKTPFLDHEFDRVVIVDFLEHIEDDQAFIQELFRVMKRGGELIINVPHVKETLLRKFRLMIGQTDERHGHVRPGYTRESLERLLGDSFTLVASFTYSKFFSEAIDTLMTFLLGLLKKNEKSQKGMVVSEQDLQKNKKMFKIYSLIYPILWFLGQWDKLVFTSGYMLMAKALRK